MQVTFETKDRLNKDGIHNKFRAQDANELKDCVNSKLDNPGVIAAGARPLVLCSSFNASSGLFPATGGTGAAGAIQKGNIFRITGAGNLAGEEVESISSVMAWEDAPGQDVDKWHLNF